MTIGPTYESLNELERRREENKKLIDGKLTLGDGGRFTYELDVSEDGGKRALVELEGTDLKISLVQGQGRERILLREMTEPILDEGEKIAAFKACVSEGLLTIKGVKILLSPGWETRIRGVLADIEIS